MVQTDTSTLDLTAVAGTLERGELTSLELTEAVSSRLPASIPVCRP